MRPTGVRGGSVILAVLAVVLGGCTASAPGSSPTLSPSAASVSPAALPRVNTAATPAGWAPVAVGDGQISVPASWVLQWPGLQECVPATGKVFVGELPAPAGSGPACQLPANVVSIRATVLAGTAGTVNGIPVRVSTPAAGRAVSAPSLGITVSARGPLATRVLATLTRSPLTVALAPASGPPAPASWVRLSFAGISFAVPAGWPVQRQDSWGNCRPDMIFGSRVVLSTGQRLLVLPCPAPLNTAGRMAAQPGITVGAGKGPLKGLAPSGRACLTRPGLRLCPLAPPPADSALFLQVDLPGRPAAALVEIGLSGDGLTARTILDSIRAG